MTLLEQMKERREALKKELDAMVQKSLDESRGMTTEEDAEFEAKATELRSADGRIDELIEAEKREQAAAQHVATITTATASVRDEPNPVYRKDAKPSDPSYFRDLAADQLGRLDLAPGAVSAREIRERLVRSQETRAGDMTTAAGAGGEFAPPLWLVEDFIALARAGRVTADLCQKDTLPPGVSSLNLPKVSTGTTVAVQATQNSALSDTAMTTTSVSSGITTVGGKQIISMQLLQQSGIPFDRVILEDLALAYATKVDSQVLYGANGSGEVRGLVGFATNNAFTTASPAPASVTNANSLYYIVQKAAAAVQRGRFMPADALVMSPERWAWILGSVDANARPYVIPDGNSYNPLGTNDGVVAQGPAGHFGAYPVYTDPTISLTANSATNQDEIYVLRTRDLYLWESPVQSASFDATYADNASILFRVLGYMAFIPNRYAASVQSIRGTGLVLP